jgi:Glycosyl transferase family 2
MLEEAIASVRSQTSSAPELCLVDDVSTDPEVISARERNAASDPRIHLTRHETAGGISAANTALEVAAGEENPRHVRNPVSALHEPRHHVHVVRAVGLGSKSADLREDRTPRPVRLVVDERAR